MSNSYQRFIDTAQNYGLNVRETTQGRQASVQGPGHGARDLSISVTYNGTRTLIHCHSPRDTADDVLKELGLTWEDMRDEPTTTYQYADGLKAFRTPNKGFRQQCEHGKSPSKCDPCKEKVRPLYGVETLSIEGPVYVLEGEEDQHTAMNVCGVASVTQVAGANNPVHRADWTVLKGRDVIIVRDGDTPGHKRAEKVREYLESLEGGPATVQVVDVAAGKDLSDHVAAGRGLEELTPVEVFGEPRRKIALIKAASVRTERLEFLIEAWVPRRSLTLLAGREGLGKSTIACGIAAQATRGELDGTPMNVAYLNTEDSRSITVKPRLEAAGADLDRVFFIDVTTEAGNTGSLQLPGDTSLLARELAANNVGLVILDAAKSAMHSSLDGYRDDDVRQFLEPLASMCDEHDMVVIGLVHFGKRESNDPGKLILGSVAWSQIARSVLSVAVDDEGTLIVTNTKGNLAPAQVSREARIESVTIPTDDGKHTDVGRVVWGDNTNVSAADLLVSHDEDDDRTDCEIWLGDYLDQHGPTRRKKVLDDARKAGFTVSKTVQRAFKKIGGESGYTATVPREAEWSLPDLSFGDTGDMKDTSPLVHVPAVPTVPTGPDLHKRNVPTVGGFQQGHKGHVQGAPVPTVSTDTHPKDMTPTFAQPKLSGDTELEDMVIGSLHAEYPMGLKVVEQSIPPMHRDQVPATLDSLLDAGLVIQDIAGRYLLNSAQKATA